MIFQHHSWRPSVFWSDNAREYLAKPIQAFLQQHMTTFPPHPDMNAFVERINRTLLTAARAALTHVRLPTHYWPYSIMDTAHKYNFMPHSATKHTPYQQWHGPQHEIPHLVPFGAVRTKPIRSSMTKLQSRALHCRYMYTLNNTQIMVMAIADRSMHNVRTCEFRPLHLAVDPATILAQAFATRKHTPPPTHITPATPSPSSVHTAHQYPYPTLWEIVHNQELQELDDQNAI